LTRGAPLEGVVDADETFVGGKEKNKYQHKKTPGSQGGANRAVVLGVWNVIASLARRSLKKPRRKPCRALFVRTSRLTEMIEAAAMDWDHRDPFNNMITI